MNITKCLPINDLRSITAVPASSICWAILILLVAGFSFADAQDQIRLTVTGQLVIEEFPNPPDLLLEEELGLEAGDPVEFIFEFGSSVQPNGVFFLDSVNGSIGDLNFSPEPTDISIDVTQTADSGIGFQASFASLLPADEAGVILSPLSGTALLLSFQTNEIGAELPQFPVNFTEADVTSFTPGPLGLSDDQSFSSILEFDLSQVVSTLLGDVNFDNEVDLLDVAPFVELILSGGFNDAADINGDGAIDLLDVLPFVQLVTG